MRARTGGISPDDQRRLLILAVLRAQHRAWERQVRVHAAQVVWLIERTLRSLGLAPAELRQAARLVADTLESWRSTAPPAELLIGRPAAPRRALATINGDWREGDRLDARKAATVLAVLEPVLATLEVTPERLGEIRAELLERLDDVVDWHAPSVEPRVRLGHRTPGTGKDRLPT